MNFPRISIIMSVYNGSRYLSESIQSIINQTYPDFEFIIVDDGSTDNTFEILNEYSRQDSRILIYRSETNLGLAGGLNIGLKYAKGEYIARQDADDISLPERLFKQVEFMDSNPDYGLVGVAAQLVDSNGNFLKIDYNISGNEEIQLNLLDYMCICGAAIMVRRECMEAIGYNFNEKLETAEDYDLVLRLGEITKLEVLQDPLYIYIQHSESECHTKKLKLAFDKASVLQHTIFRRYNNNPPVNKLHLISRDYLLAAIIGIRQKDLGLAKVGLKRALEFYPLLLDNNLPLEDLVIAYTPVGSINSSEEFVLSIFDDLLPKTRLLSQMRSRILSNLYMGEVFSKFNSKQYQYLGNHLIAGIRYNPGWLLNRGVISIIIKSIIGKVPDYLMKQKI
jgi:glycosyltransferase involved in cell wall biosynthesis